MTALALYCLEREGMGSVLHTAMDRSKPWTNRTVRSRNRADLLAGAGSRYAPSSPCDGLQSVQDSPSPASSSASPATVLRPPRCPIPSRRSKTKSGFRSHSFAPGPQVHREPSMFLARFGSHRATFAVSAIAARAGPADSVSLAITGPQAALYPTPNRGEDSPGTVPGAATSAPTVWANPRISPVAMRGNVSPMTRMPAGRSWSFVRNAAPPFCAGQCTRGTSIWNRSSLKPSSPRSITYFGNGRKYSAAC